ncbi:MAG: hypothetical protein K9L22_12150, partial [Methylococcaceae bacterium]|nr:hypothetical protein [Methylococcaceae bacterium]
MINLPIPAQAQHLLNTLVPAATSIEHLKIGQQIDANIVQISKDQQNIQLSIANKQVAAFLKNDTPENKQQAALLQPGQAVKLLLIKLPPQAEVKVLLPEQPIPANKPISASVTADIQRNAPTLILKTNQNNTQTLANSPNTLQTASRIAPQILPTLTNTAHSALLSELKPQQHLSATVIYSDAKNLKLRLFIPPSSLSSSATIAPRTASQSNPVIQSSSETIKVQALITSKSTLAPPVTALPTTPQIPIATANLTSAIELPKIMALASPQTLIVDFPSSKSIPLPTLS